MSETPLPPGLNVILGDSAAGTFHQAFHPVRDRLDVDRDVLSCGPTPRCDSLEAWESMRLAFWNGWVPREPEEQPRTTMGLLERARKLRAADRITLWTGTGLSEQLSVACTIHLAEQGSAAPGKFWIVEFEYLPGRDDDIYGLGMLNQDAMRAHPEPVQLQDDALQDYRDLWAAVTSPDPAQIEQFGPKHPKSNHWLLRAARLLMRRYPDRQSGLSWWDRVLLSHAVPRPRKAARIVGDTIGENSGEGDPVGDSYLFGRLLRLGGENLSRPLIDIVGDTTSMGRTETQLTPFGHDVLEGRASNYPTNAIEDWAAGVRLSSRDGALWFNDAGHLVPG